jgi:predicted RNA-binding Zn ribbon-like protein
MAVSTQDPPHNLQLVLDFVNTLDVEKQIDELDTPAGLRAWLDEHELGSSEALRLGRSEVQRAMALREALRAVLRQHNHSAPSTNGDAPAGDLLDEVATAGRLAICFEADGSVRIAPRASGYAGVLAQLLVPVVQAAADGSWLRAKACDADDCLEAFYDNSRNRSGRWCDMAVCGNRTKVRAYRSKQPR